MQARSGSENPALDSPGAQLHRRCERVGSWTVTTHDVIEVLDRIRRRDPSRPEAQLQAEIYRLLTMGAMNLGVDEVARLEVPTSDGTKRRLDIEIGHCCIEVKKDLRIGNVLLGAREQLAGYVRKQAETFGSRYVGIITDGVSWHLHRLNDAELVEVAVLDASRAEPNDVLVWLESVLATVPNITPTPDQIHARLGADSPAHKLDHASLAELYMRTQAMPEVQVKRDLWAKLLRTAFGSGFDDSPELFIDHTLLVLTAEAIAHGVAGFDLATDGLTAHEVTRGTRFRDAQIHGVVEEDFFDWVLEADGGPAFVTELVRRVSRFDWSNAMSHDVLKSLYTSVISPQVRESLGEYYTPDWLAERMVKDVYTDPLRQRLLEPSCGSGTFLMHAVQSHLDAAEAAGMSVGEAVTSLTSHVIGMDIHPVAVSLARVSYLIAIGNKRLRDSTRGPLTIPVYLGDSIQWEQHTDLLAGTADITISTAGDDLVAGGGALFGDDLKFPLSILDDANNFDQLVSEMADAAIEPSMDTKAPKTVMGPILRRRGVTNADDQSLLTVTYDTMRRLHRSGRNHIWGYYVRNLIRPLWLTKGNNRVDVLVGNPPWLRYGKMTPSMQDRYRALAKERNLLTGGLGATGRDLSTLFVARSVELYLRSGGRFAFVMPHGVLSRQPHRGFRSGQWSSKSVSLEVSFDEAWDLDKVTTGFPMSACVIRGYQAQHEAVKALPSSVVVWEGKLPRSGDVSWQVASNSVARKTGEIADTAKAPDAAASPYRAQFRQGAILVPRYLLFVNEDSGGGPLGAGAGRVLVESARSAQEKPPWRDHESLSGPVEQSALHDVYLGENVAPFRALEPRRAVLPLMPDRLMHPAEIALLPGLARWWENVERAWEKGRKDTEKKPLLERFDYQKQFSAQLPVANHRVVYSKSGNTLAAARLEGSDAVIDHQLYWAPARSAAEARYLVAILNSATLLDRVRPLQARGLLGARHFDKYVFFVPFATFDANDPNHTLIADLAEDAELIAAQVDVTATTRFTISRSKIRAELARSGLASQLEAAVSRVLPLL